MARTKGSEQKIYLNLRLGFIVIITAQFIMTIVFSFCIPIYWLNQNNLQYYTLILLIPVGVNICQFKLILSEFNKKVPTMWLHKLYWVTNLIIQLLIVSFMAVQIEDSKSSSGLQTSSLNWISSLILFLTNLAQVIFSLVKRQDRPDFEDYSCFSFSIPNFISIIDSSHLR